MTFIVLRLHIRQSAAPWLSGLPEQFILGLKVLGQSL